MRRFTFALKAAFCLFQFLFATSVLLYGTPAFVLPQFVLFARPEPGTESDLPGESIGEPCAHAVHSSAHNIAARLAASPSLPGFWPHTPA